MELCELPKEYVGRVEVRGVHLDYSSEKKVLGMVITGIMKYKKSNGVLPLNTPHKSEHFYNEKDTDNDSQLIPDECAEILYELFKESKKYIKGERLQVEMFRPPSTLPPKEGDVTKGKLEKVK